MAKGTEGNDVGHSIVDLDGNWVKILRDRLQKASHNELSLEHTIYRVPESIRQYDETPNVYDPYIISIGPYHRGKPRLQAMEEFKWRYLYDFLSRNPYNSLEYFLKEMKKEEAEVRSCYSEKIELESNDFVEMLLLDGCFIVEFLVKQMVEGNPSLDSQIWFFHCLHHDMLLLENQIPFSILQWFYNLVEPPYDIPLSNWALIFLTNDGKRLKDSRIPKRETTHHLLHLYHSYLMPSPQSEIPQSLHSNPSCFLSTLEFMFKKMKLILSLLSTFGRSTSSSFGNDLHLRQLQPPLTIPSATKLHEAGIKFMKKDTQSFLDIEFINGVMRIPHLYISDDTYSIFRNLIALEQCYPNSKTQFTSYAFFMDFIVNTPNDVELLCKKEIILHIMGSNEEVAILFNKLCKGVTRHPRISYLSCLFKEVADYYGSNWHVWRAKLMRDYFSNPWAVVSLVAAFILLFLTFIQTLFSFLSYLHG